LLLLRGSQADLIDEGVLKSTKTMVRGHEGNRLTYASSAELSCVIWQETEEIAARACASGPQSDAALESVVDGLADW
jgi:hypothetical protein